MRPEKLIQMIKIASVIIAVVAFLGLAFMKQIILGIILATGVLLLGVAVIYMYRTDYLSELKN